MFTRDYGFRILQKIFFIVYLQKSGTALAGRTRMVPTFALYTNLYRQDSLSVKICKYNEAVTIIMSTPCLIHA